MLLPGDSRCGGPLTIDAPAAAPYVADLSFLVSRQCVLVRKEGQALRKTPLEHIMLLMCVAVHKYLAHHVEGFACHR